MATKELHTDEEARLLYARLDDLAERSRRGEVSLTRFLTPREVRRGEDYLCRIGLGDSYLFYGGYPEAERGCLLLLPDYLAGIPELTPESALEASGNTPAIVSVRICGSGYRALSHRDYLGSLLALGVEREVVGDILPLSEKEALLFCLAHMSDFFCANLTKVANDTVHVKPCVLPPDFAPLRPTQPLSDTVASERLDCIVAALANLSRDAAQTAIRSGLVEVEYEPEERVDCNLAPPCVLSVRGIGKFRVLSVGTVTRRGRLRLTAEKYL